MESLKICKITTEFEQKPPTLKNYPQILIYVMKKPLTFEQIFNINDGEKFISSHGMVVTKIPKNEKIFGTEEDKEPTLYLSFNNETGFLSTTEKGYNRDKLKLFTPTFNLLRKNKFTYTENGWFKRDNVQINLKTKQLKINNQIYDFNTVTDIEKLSNIQLKP